MTKALVKHHCTDPACNARRARIQGYGEALAVMDEIWAKATRHDDDDFEEDLE